MCALSLSLLFACRMRESTPASMQSKKFFQFTCESDFLYIFLNFLVHFLLQFEGEKFVDGLLGIGSAGGKSSTTEGANLKSRLETLRRERAKRAPVISKQKRTPVAAAGAGGDNSTTSIGNFNHVTPQGAPTRNTSSKRRNRRKKGKKGKR